MSVLVGKITLVTNEDPKFHGVPELYVVGDSLAVATDPIIRSLAAADGVTYTFVGHSGASIDTAMAAVLQFRPSPNAVVFISLGTNEPIDNPARFTGFVEYVVRFFIRYEVYWLNLNIPLDEENNAILKEASGRWDNLHYVDWKSYALEHGLVTTDQVHYDEAGTLARANLIYDTYRDLVGI